MHDQAFPHYEIKDSAGRVWHVNPLMADLPSYINRLRSVLDLYRARVEAMALAVMDDGAREEHAAATLQAQRWDIVLRVAATSDRSDFALMEQEITHGEQYLEQAREMQQSLQPLPRASLPAPEPSPLSLTFDPREVGLSMTRSRPIQLGKSARPPGTAGHTDLSNTANGRPRNSDWSLFSGTGRRDVFSPASSLSRFADPAFEPPSPIASQQGSVLSGLGGVGGRSGARRSWHPNAGLAFGDLVVALHSQV